MGSPRSIPESKPWYRYSKFELTTAIRERIEMLGPQWLRPYNSKQRPLDILDTVLQQVSHFSTP